MAERPAAEFNGFLALDWNAVPLMPHAWYGKKPAELWSWGDLYAIVGEKSPIYRDVMKYLRGEMPVYEGLIYICSVSVFVRGGHPADGSDPLPILVTTIEFRDYGAPEREEAKRKGLPPIPIDDSKLSPFMVCAFCNDKHSVFGEFTGEHTPDEMRKCLFDKARELLGVEGEPTLVGDRALAFGHPATGIPPRENKEEIGKSENEGKTAAPDDEGEKWPGQFKQFQRLNPLWVPTVPSYWTVGSEDELWAWGELFVIVQKSPPMFRDAYLRAMGEDPGYKGMFYLHAASVFVRWEGCPWDAARPMLVVTLEQCDHGALPYLKEGMGPMPVSERGKDMGNVMLCAFFNDSRENYGDYKGSLEKGEARKALFDKARKILDVEGEPTLVGPANLAFGHPATGIAPKPASKPKKKGCAASTAALAIAVVLIVYGVFC